MQFMPQAQGHVKWGLQVATSLVLKRRSRITLLRVASEASVSARVHSSNFQHNSTPKARTKSLFLLEL